MKWRPLWIFYWFIAVIGLVSGQPRQPMNTVYKASSLGGQQVLPCEVVYPYHQQEDLQFVVTWRKGSLGLNQVLLTKVDGYSPTIEKEYQDRLEIVNKASLRISHIEAKDQDWYECSILFMNGPIDTSTNNTWIYLTVHSPPQITRSSPTPQNKARGESAKLFCEGNGFPEPKVTWMKDGHPLNNSIRTTVETNEVRIVNLQREDGGIYTCTFTNIVGDRSQPMKLVIEGGPYIMTQPGNQTVLEGQRVNLPCGTEGYPNIISHTWLKDQVDVRTSDGFKAQRISILTDGSLVIKTAVKTDKGWYLCRASNGLGHDEASAYINVVYKPVVLPLPSQLIWAKGYRQQIDCPVDSNPPLQLIIWVKDQEQLQSKGRFDILDNGTLLVSDVMDIDAGSYRCTPENAMGQGLSSNRVQVMVKDPPQISVSPQPLYIRNVGESVIMKCEATGTPAVSLQWIKVGGKLGDGSNRFTVTDKYLEIKNLTKEDHGKYECRAINTIATVVSVTELRIDNTTPHAPFNVTVVPGVFNIMISWEPAYDGGTPQFYILWFRETLKFEWSTMPLNSPTATYFNLYGLLADTEYEFKILSRNSIGDGSYSEVVRKRTLGYSPDAVNSLPTYINGTPYYPEVKNNSGPVPSSPHDLEAQVDGSNIQLKWRTPSISPVPIFSYVIAYKHNDNSQKNYDSRIVGNTTSTAEMYDMPTGNYDIRLRSCGVLACSSYSNVVSVQVPGDDVVIPQAMVGGIIGGVLFLLVAILLALVAVFYSRRKERKAKEKKYDDVNYGKPDEMNGRHHESTPKRDRWQHNGGGDLVTTLNNTDSIFFLPQTRSPNKPAIGMTRPLILLDKKNNMDSLYGRGVDDGKVYDKDYGKQVPLTNELSYTTDRSQPGTSKQKYDQAKLDVRNLMWQNQQHDASLEQQPLSRSLNPHTSYDHVPAYQHSHPQEHLQHSPIPQSYPHLFKSHSIPSHRPDNVGQFLPLVSQYPSHSIHTLPPSYPSHHIQPQPVYSSSHPSSPQTIPLDPAVRSSIQQSRPNSDEYPSFQSQDDDVFKNLPQPSGVTGFPRHSSMKPSHMTYLIDGDEDQHPDQLFGLADISSVLEPSSEHPSKTGMTLDKLPSGHPLNRSNIADGIPGYYINTGDSTAPFMMVGPHQNQLRLSGAFDGGHDNVRPQSFTQSQIPGDFEQHQTAPGVRSQDPRLPFQPDFSVLSDPFPQSRPQHHDHPAYFSHSNLRLPDDYSTLDSRDSQRPEFLDEPYYHNEPPRPRAHSEGSRRKRHTPHSGDRDYGQDFPNGGRPPYSSASYPDMTQPAHERTSLGVGHRDQQLPYRDTQGHSYGPDGHQYNEPFQKPQHFYHIPHQQSTSSLSRDRTAAPFYQRSSEPHPHDVPKYSQRDVHPDMYTAPTHGYPGAYGDQPRHHYGDETIPADLGSHSSGIGSRNTSQSTNSYHPHRRGSAGKGSASFSSGQGHDMSLDMSAGHGQPSHRRDMSGDENYEFDSLNALENDIMDDLRRYSQLSGGPGAANSSQSMTQQDSSVPHPSKPSQYPDSERRFEKLREEFKQYRQQQYDPSDGLLQMPPTATAALPIGMHGEPLYPMDSEML